MGMRRKAKTKADSSAEPEADASAGPVVQKDAATASEPPKKRLKNKTKVLFLTTRGVTARFRHLIEDLRVLLPHAKKEQKHDAKHTLQIANEVAELRSCDTIMLFEARKHRDLYLWLTKRSGGPSIKFHVDNIHTMNELGFPGNNLMYSRPLLTFDPGFDTTPMMRLCKELLTHAFAAPQGHTHTKPFVDHCVSFYYLDGRVWVRHYQIVDAALDEKTQDKDVESTLVEIGPRFVLTPIKCFGDSLSGPILWENQAYVSPNAVRAALRKGTIRKSIGKEVQRKKRARHLEKNPIVQDPINKVFQ